MSDNLTTILANLTSALSEHTNYNVSSNNVNYSANSSIYAEWNNSSSNTTFYPSSEVANNDDAHYENVSILTTGAENHYEAHKKHGKSPHKKLSNEEDLFNDTSSKYYNNDTIPIANQSSVNVKTNETLNSSANDDGLLNLSDVTNKYGNTSNSTIVYNKSDDYRINKNKSQHHFSLLHFIGWLLLFAALTMLTVVLLNWFMRRRQQRKGNGLDDDDDDDEEELIGGNYLGSKNKKKNNSKDSVSKHGLVSKINETAHELSPLTSGVVDSDSHLTGDPNSNSNLSQNSLRSEGNTSRQRFLEARRAAAMHKNYGAVEEAKDERDISTIQHL